MPVNLAVDKHGKSIGAPRASEIHILYTGSTLYVTAVEHVAHLDIPGRGSSGDIRVALGIDGTILKQGGRRTENKVGSALYIAIGKIKA